MLEEQKGEPKFVVELTLDQIRTLAVALEAAGRLNGGQLEIAHEYVAPDSNRALKKGYTTGEALTLRTILRRFRDPGDNELHHKFEGLMYNFRGFYHNYLADQKGMPESERMSFVIYDGPEILAHPKIKIQEVD